MSPLLRRSMVGRIAWVMLMRPITLVANITFMSASDIAGLLAMPPTATPLKYQVLLALRFCALVSMR